MLTLSHAPRSRDVLWRRYTIFSAEPIRCVSCGDRYDLLPCVHPIKMPVQWTRKSRLLSRSWMPWTVALVSRCDPEPRALLSCSAPTGKHLSSSRLWPAWTAWRRWRNVRWEWEDRELVIGMLCLCIRRQKLSVGWEEAGRREEGWMTTIKSGPLNLISLTRETCDQKP